MNRRLLILLSIAVVLGGFLIADRMMKADDVTVPQRANTAQSQQTTAPRNPAGTAPDTLLASISEYQQIWQRTLFSKTRKPSVFVTQSRATTNAGSGQKNSDEPPDFTIVGAAIRPGGGSVLIRKKTREIVRVFVGDTVDGWTVETVSVDSAILSQNGKSWELPVGAQ